MKRFFGIGLLACISLVGGVCLGLYLNQRSSYVETTIQLPQGVSASVYNDLGGDGPYNYDETSSPVGYVSNGDSLKLKKGIYDVVLDNASQYANSVTKVSVDSGTRKLAISPVFTDTKLQELLPTERPKAIEALHKKYPLINTNYVISADILGGVGDWYGAVLKPKNPEYDTLRVVLHKKNGEWSVAISRPMLSIGTPSNPDIPADFIKSVDRL